MASSNDPYSDERPADDDLEATGLGASNISAQPDILPKSETKQPLQPIPPSDDDFFLPDFNNDTDENEPYHANSDLKP